jgi:hypothetical protein
MSKKFVGLSTLADKIKEGKKTKVEKENVTLSIDKKILAEGKRHFEGQLSSILEAALRDLLDDKKGRGA